MNHEQTFQCIDLIYRTAMDSRQWRPLLNYLQVCLGGSAMAWVDYQFESKSGAIVHTIGHDPEYVRNYHYQFAEIDPWMQSSESYREGTVIIGEEIIDNESLLNTGFYHHWLEPQHLFYRICAVVRQQKDHYYCLQALRARSAGSFMGDERSFFSTIVPHLTHAMGLNRSLWQMKVVEDVLRYQPYSILIVDRNGTVLFANASSTSVLTEANGLFIRDNTLVAANNHLNRKLKAVIENASQTAITLPKIQGLANSPPLVLSRGKTKQPLSVMVLPLHRKLRPVVGQANEVAIVFISTPELGSELPCSVLADLYNLTPAEGRLLRLILGGLRLCDASDELGITQNTARTHMKRIYAKTGVERQVDLVRLGLNWNTLVNQP